MAEGLTYITYQSLLSGIELFFSPLQWDILNLGSVQSADHQISLWIKIAFTVFVVILIPVYWKQWGPANFLWFSDIALFLSVPALWMESELLASMMAVGVLLPELYWNFELLVRLITGFRLAGLTDYMWDKEKPLYLRLLSLFHVVLPATLILMLLNFGYDPSAFYFQTLLAWVILLLCYKFTPPSSNINWVFGLGNSPQHKIPSEYFLLIIMIAYAIVVFLPTHLVLNAIFNDA